MSSDAERTSLYITCDPKELVLLVAAQVEEDTDIGKIIKYVMGIYLQKRLTTGQEIK